MYVKIIHQDSPCTIVVVVVVVVAIVVVVGGGGVVVVVVVSERFNSHITMEMAYHS